MQGEAFARAHAYIVFKANVDAHFVAGFVCRHAEIFEGVADIGDVDGKPRLFARPLMGHAGIVNLIEQTALHQHVFSASPAFDAVAEADFFFFAPDDAADHAEIAVSEGDIANIGIAVAVNGGVDEGEVFKDGIFAAGNHMASAIECNFNGSVAQGGISDGVQKQTAL